MKKERPILYSTMMVRALLSNRKTQTRRTSGLKKINENPDHWEFMPEWGIGISDRVYVFRNKISQEVVSFKSPYGKTGDILWVRESFISGFEMDDGVFTCDEQGELIPRTWYRASNTDLRWYDKQSDFPPENVPWKPSIHMPKSVARIWLEVESLSIERLHDITESDAMAEGVERTIADLAGFGARAVGLRLFRDYGRTDNSLTNHPRNGFESAKVSFETLWISINEQASWDADPWVWVVKFKVLSTTGKPESIAGMNQ